MPSNARCSSTSAALLVAAPIVKLANGIKNVPTTKAALASSDLEVDPAFKTFLDMFANPDSHYKPTTAIGDGDQAAIGAVLEDWQVGKIDDPQAALQEAADEVNNLLAEAQA